MEMMACDWITTHMTAGDIADITHMCCRQDTPVLQTRHTCVADKTHLCCRQDTPVLQARHTCLVDKTSMLHHIPYLTYLT